MKERQFSPPVAIPNALLKKIDRLAQEIRRTYPMGDQTDTAGMPGHGYVAAWWGYEQRIHHYDSRLRNGMELFWLRRWFYAVKSGREWLEWGAKNPTTWHQMVRISPDWNPADLDAGYGLEYQDNGEVSHLVKIDERLVLFNAENFVDQYIWGWSPDSRDF